MTIEQQQLAIYKEDLPKAQRRLDRNLAAGRTAMAEMDAGRVKQLKRQIAKLED